MEQNKSVIESTRDFVAEKFDQAKDWLAKQPSDEDIYYDEDIGNQTEGQQLPHLMKPQTGAGGPQGAPQSVQPQVQVGQQPFSQEHIVTQQPTFQQTMLQQPAQQTGQQFGGRGRNLGVPRRQRMRPMSRVGQQGPQQPSQIVFNQLQGVQGPFGRFRGESVNICNEEKLPSSVRELLEQIPLEAMMIENWVQKRLVLVGDNQPLDKALARLNRHKISSIPIINEANGNIRGLLHSLDIINYLKDILSAEPLQPARWDFNLQTTATLLGKSQSKTMVISNRATMYEAVQEFAKGTERLMVVDQQCELHPQKQEEQGILGLFTQSDVLNFFGRNPYWLNMAAKAQQPLKQLLNGQYAQNVVTIQQTEAASAGFQKMADSNTSAIAIVDSQGRIVANLSATNIRGINRRNFQLLNRPLYEFLQRDRRRGWWTMPVTIRETDTLEKTVLQFCAAKVHHLYVVDDDGKPCNVVTPTDLLKHFVESS